MIVQSIQPPALVDQFLSFPPDQPFLPDFSQSSFSGDLSFELAYLFMAKHLKRHLSSRTHLHPAILHYCQSSIHPSMWWHWVWTNHRRQSKVDLRCISHVEPMVLLTLDIPEDFLLFSDFDLWHCVLNHSPIAWPDSDLDPDIQLRMDHLQHFNPDYNPYRHPSLWTYPILEQQWESIFTLERQADSSFTLPHFNEELSPAPNNQAHYRTVQAVTPFWLSSWVQSTRSIAPKSISTLPFYAPPSRAFQNAFAPAPYDFYPSP